MMCREFQGLIEAYLTGMMHKGGVADFEGHLRSCSACAERFRKAEALLSETGSALEWAMPEADVTDRLVERVAAAAIAPQKTWGDVMREQWERAPWWMISAAVHATILMLMTVITVATASKKTDDIVITTDLAKKKEPEYDEKKIRDIFRNTKEVEAEELVENPVFVHEEVEVTDHFETENDMDTHTARGQEDAISDIPLGGTGVVGNIGVGGGGAGCFGYRTGGGRRRCVAKFGGSRASESAVDAALRWLARHQEPDGHWDTQKYGPKNPNDTGCTGLACLAFLGAGHTERAGKFKNNVKAAVAWLMQNQNNEGAVGRKEQHFGYHHAIGALALAEAYGMGRNPKVGEAAQRALDWSIDKHQVEYSGWRYSAKQAADLSVTGWFVMQLKSAKVAGLKVQGKAFSGAMAFVDKCTTKPDQRPANVYGGPYDYTYGGLCGYMNASEKVGPTTTSIGLVCRLFMGVKPREQIMLGGAECLLKNLPSWSATPSYFRNAKGGNFYYWYYGTLSMFQIGGHYWKAWNVAMRDMLIQNQRRGGDEDGSWDFAGDELGAREGGRVYTTALGALCLEIYYRYLPMYGK